MDQLDLDSIDPVAGSDHLTEVVGIDRWVEADHSHRAADTLVQTDLASTDCQV